MTSIHENKSLKDINLLNFLNGIRTTTYTVPEEFGFQTTGNIGSLLNSHPTKLSNIYDGIMFNPTNRTDSSGTIIGRVHPMKNDWTILTVEQPPTPQLYCNEQPLSELMPFYPNGVPNKILNPTCNMTIDGVASPTLAGISMMGGNDPSMFNNPHNDIGHQINAYGYANKYGTRALGEGKVACQELTEGLNVPPLKVKRNNHSAYVANPGLSLPGQTDLQDLYTVGNWTDPQKFPNNFINRFNENVGQGCSETPVRPIHRGPGGRKNN
uniref:Uncharacterized protein n=1 Tax=viral metagenome TaxID=1070528 RepID=A0A6C0LCP5_9ZZZZ